MGIPGEKREKGAEGISEEVLAEVFHNFMKNISLCIQEALLTPNRVNSKRSTPRHSVDKLLKANNKERNLKAEREKQFTIH